MLRASAFSSRPVSSRSNSALKIRASQNAEVRRPLFSHTTVPAFAGLSGLTTRAYTTAPPTKPRTTKTVKSATRSAEPVAAASAKVPKPVETNESGDILINTKAENVSSSILKLVEEEINKAPAAGWAWGDDFLAKYNYDLTTNEEGEIMLSRTIEKTRVEISFEPFAENQNPEEEEEDDLAEEEEEEEDVEEDPEMGENHLNKLHEENEKMLADMEAKVKVEKERLERLQSGQLSEEEAQAIQEEMAASSKKAVRPFVVTLIKNEPDAAVINPERTDMHFFCQVRPDYTIDIVGLGGSNPDWSVDFEELSPSLKDRFIDYLVELDLAGEIGQFVRDYAENAQTTLTSGNLKRMRAFLAK